MLLYVYNYEENRQKKDSMNINTYSQLYIKTVAKDALRIIASQVEMSVICCTSVIILPVTCLSK